MPAAHCDLGQEACAQVGLAARFHDIGKIGIPDEVLLAPRRHTDEERAIMREHPVRGEHIFRRPVAVTPRRSRS